MDYEETLFHIRIVYSSNMVHKSATNNPYAAEKIARIESIQKAILLLLNDHTGGGAKD